MIPFSNLTLLPAVLLPALCACQALSKAPKGAPRIETEFAVDIDESFDQALDDGDGGALVRATVQDTVGSLADMGLRFYAVPSADYLTEHVRPPHLLTIAVHDFVVAWKDEVIKVEDGEVYRARVHQLACSATASFVERRPDGPSLSVGRGQGHATVKVKKPELEDLLRATVAVRNPPDTGAGLAVRREDLERVVKKAAIEALKEIEDPIDRRFTVAVVAER